MWDVAKVAVEHCAELFLPKSKKTRCLLGKYIQATTLCLGFGIKK